MRANRNVSRSNWRSRRQLEMPSESLMANSWRRSPARASRRLARLAQATSIISVTAPMRMIRGSRSRVRQLSSPLLASRISKTWFRVLFLGSVSVAAIAGVAACRQAENFGEGEARFQSRHDSQPGGEARIAGKVCHGACHGRRHPQIVTALQFRHPRNRAEVRRPLRIQHCPPGFCGRARRESRRSKSATCCKR